MKVSVITVCLDSDSTIRDTITSVLAQSYEDIEYIIIDGGSSDKTMEIVEEYMSAIAVVVSEPDNGIYDAMNKGIKLATGTVIGILNSDDFYQDNHVIRDVVSHFNSSPDSDLVCGDVVFVEPDNLHRITRFYSSSHFRSWKLRFGWMPPHPATFIKKTAYDKVGFYSLEFEISSDYEMFVRMLLVNRLIFSRLDKILVRMRSGGISTGGLRNSIRLNREIVKACKKNDVYTNLLFILLKLPFKLMELIRRPSGRLE